MLPPEPRLLKYLQLTTQPNKPDQAQLSTAAQALIVYSLVAGKEHERQESPAACTALAVRRKQGIFFIRRLGAR